MKRINLLPGDQKAKASRERGLIYAVLILVAVVVALGLVYMKYNSDVNAKNQELADVQAQTAAMEQQKVALQPYADLQTKRTTMTETAKNLYAAGVPMSIIFQELSLVIPEDVWVTSYQVVVPDSMKPGAPAAAAPTTSSSTTDITLVGITRSHRSVAEFMTRLGMMPQLQNIALSMTQLQDNSQFTKDQTIGVGFQITAHLRPYAQTPPTTTATGGAQ